MQPCFEGGGRAGCLPDWHVAQCAPQSAPSAPPAAPFTLQTRRQYEQESYDKLVKTIEGQDLLPQVGAALRACKLSLAAGHDCPLICR